MLVPPVWYHVNPDTTVPLPNKLGNEYVPVPSLVAVTTGLEGSPFLK